MADPVPLDVRPLPTLSLQASVDEVIGKLDPETKMAVVAVADFGHARLAVMARADAHWSFVGFLEKPYAGKLTGGAEVRWTA